ncbi:BZ3500_MvSof-1268-A1-R1_Chr10-1g02588 [Microbotryum saponariae]|uniref:Carboxylic ester hydrolase n=1 Tax=Microbotryum saponariae TaxID=289078 RepID=A0A2X0NKN3_9BASI|nr:BZ3500_MvSof-1268-A1-R1_Chr10-1g02588 [Microbotryum saponariae]SDA06077.1 BZ3501_MvSof-1269-A2-R1_Chr10-1g02189 [Microbotryum saponariae]
MVGFGTSSSFLIAAAAAALCLTGVDALPRPEDSTARVPGTDFSTRCANMASVKMPNMTIYATTHYDAGTTFSTPDGELPPLPSTASPDYHDPVPGLAAFCRFGAEIETSSQSKVRFELWMPDDWSGRFAMVGNGGDAGGVNYPDMGVPLTKCEFLFLRPTPSLHTVSTDSPSLRCSSGSSTTDKFAVASTDTGHNGSSLDGTFAISNPQTQIDFGHRAVHLTATYSKKLIRSYYGGNGAKYNYWIGCSSGGKQGLKEIQLNAYTFDGVLAGAAAQWWSRESETSVSQSICMNLNGQTYRINSFVNKLNSEGYLTPANYATIGTEVLKQCDVLGQDKLKDGIITDPTKCSPKLEGLLCSAQGADNSTCLSQAQIKTMYAIWADWKSSTVLATGPGGTNYFPGFEPGAEGYSGFSVNGWPFNPAPDYFNYQVLNKTSPQGFSVESEADFEKLLKIADDTDPGQTNAINPDIRGFLSRGKLITYVGLSDNLIPPGSTLLYHDRVKATLGNVDNSFRLFAIPGMLHCGGGNGAYHLGQSSQRDISLGGSLQSASFTAKDDMILALIAWTEKNQAPDSLVGVNYVGGDKRQGVAFERLMCPWPQMGYYRDGDTSKAKSFRCK